MNKKLCALTALALTAALTLCACGKKTEAPAPTGSPAVQTAPSEAAKARELTADISLTVTPWSSPNGATVDLTAVPGTHEKGDSAEFVVSLAEEELFRIPCQWDSGAFTASADLNAADGYRYAVVLSAEGGASSEIPVNAEEYLRNLGASLASFCTLTLSDSVLENGDLTILDGYALVQCPIITENSETVACAQANLVLLLDDEQITSVGLTMAPGEADRSYDASITDLSFPIPEDMAEGQQLVLRLDVQLTNGQTLTAQGGNWSLENGIMANSVG